MKFTRTEIEGCYLITNKTIHDERGYFCVPYNEKVFKDNIENFIPFVQDNMSYSKKNVIRGLHFQTGEYDQAKLVTCNYGRVLDVIVDIRKNSHTFGRVLTFELGIGMDRQIYIPRGCAHGFSVLSENAIFQYKVDNEYNKEHEGGIIYNDETLKINWYVNPNDEIISEKDKHLPTFISL